MGDDEPLPLPFDRGFVGDLGGEVVEIAATEGLEVEGPAPGASIEAAAPTIGGAWNWPLVLPGITPLASATSSVIIIPGCGGIETTAPLPLII